MLRKTLLLVFTCWSFISSAQKNALGFTLGYGYFENKTWNALQDTYHQTLDTIQNKHPYLHHLPTAGLVYERQLAEYLYVQPFAQYQYVQTVSRNSSITLKLKAHFVSGGVHLNWYPIKMAKGLKKTALNPLYLRLMLGTSYSFNSITRDNLVVYDDSTKNARSVNLSIFAGAGLGYDLHFGKRLVFQPFAGIRFYPNMGMQSMSYFIDSIKRYDQEDAGLARELMIQAAFLYLF